MKNIVLVLLVCFTAVAQAYTFGQAGSSGYDGQSGRSGSDGQSVSLIAAGQDLVLNLNGQSGSAGEDGSFGSDAYACNQPRGFRNEYGAPGGSGGDGGRGGSGGDGGSAKIFFENLEQLKSIYISNQGGSGAPGGYGASGGAACHCRTYNWTKRKCRNVDVCKDVKKCKMVDGKKVCTTKRVCRPVKKCTNYSYSCSNGRDGYHGKNASFGNSGSRGSITLVQGMTKLPVETPRVGVSIASLASHQVSLSKNMWIQKSGAQSLFSLGSNISNTYSEFVENAKTQVELKWMSKRDMAKFANIGIRVSYDGQQIHVRFSDEVFVDFTVVQTTSQLKTVIVKNIYSKQEMTNLSVTTEGSKKNFKIIISDAAALSLIASNKVQLTLKLKSTMLVWRTLFGGTLDASKYTVEDNQIVIHAGKLGIKPKKLRRGKKIKFSLHVTRSFGNNSAVVDLSKGKFRI